MKYTKNTILHAKGIKVKSKGKVWVFHKYDDDNWPSVPHGHAENGDERINPWNGMIYDGNGKAIGKVNKKELNRLHSDKKFMSFIHSCKQEYKKRYPEKSHNNEDHINVMYINSTITDSQEYKKYIKYEPIYGVRRKKFASSLYKIRKI